MTCARGAHREYKQRIYSRVGLPNLIFHEIPGNTKLNRALDRYVNGLTLYVRKLSYVAIILNMYNLELNDNDISVPLVYVHV